MNSPSDISMGDLAGLLHETYMDFDMIDEDVSDAFNRKDVAATDRVLEEHVPKLQAAVTSAVVVIDGLTELVVGLQSQVDDLTDGESGSSMAE